MIRFDSNLACILESLYLEEPLTASLSGVTIIVNPVRLQFQASKTVIINNRDYILTQQRGLGNTIISRFSGVPGTTHVPYLPRIIPEIMWDGRYIDDPAEFPEDFMFDGTTLFIPKIRGYQAPAGEDLDYIGYLQFQVGYNHFPDSPFRDLDILKCREGLGI